MVSDKWPVITRIRLCLGQIWRILPLCKVSNSKILVYLYTQKIVRYLMFNFIVKFNGGGGLEDHNFSPNVDKVSGGEPQTTLPMGYFLPL